MPYSGKLKNLSVKTCKGLVLFQMSFPNITSLVIKKKKTFKTLN